MQTVTRHSAAIPLLGFGGFRMNDGAVPRDVWRLAIGAKHGKTAAQVGLRWLLQQSFIARTKMAQPEHVAENCAVFDFVLSEPDSTAIAALARADGRIVSPDGLAPVWAA